MMRTVLRLGGILGLVTGLAAFGLAYTYDATRERIAEQIREGQLAAARAVLPGVPGLEGISERPDLLGLVKEKAPLVERVFEGRDGERSLGYAVQVMPRGYGGPINLVVGIDPDGKITAIAVVEHRETPGLGTYIEEEWWRSTFAGKTAADPLRANKDIDTVSGATISGKAVLRGVREALTARGVFAGGGR